MGDRAGTNRGKGTMMCARAIDGETWKILAAAVQSRPCPQTERQGARAKFGELALKIAI